MPSQSIRDFRRRQRGPAAQEFDVLVLTALYEPGFRGGGPVKSTVNVVDSAPREVRVLVVTLDRDDGARSAYPGLSGQVVAGSGATRIVYLDVRRLGQLVDLLRILHAQRFRLVYLNSCWQPEFTLVPLVLLRLGVLRARTKLLAPHGEFAPSALEQKRAKKRLVLPVVRRLTRDFLWHASAAGEADDIRATIPGARVLLRPTPTALPPTALPVPTGSPPRPRLVYISRITSVKNLHLVLEAMRSLECALSFDIYGPVGDEGYWRRCQAVLATLPENVAATYHGALAPDQVRRRFNEHDLFVLPTGGENYCHAIAESLSASCPVLASDRTPWTSVLRDGGGVVLPRLDVAAIHDAIAAWAVSSRADLDGLRDRAGAAYARWHADQPRGHVLVDAMSARDRS